MKIVKATVRGGRLVLDEPTDLPEGEEVALVPVEEVLANGGDLLDAEERERLHAALDRSLAQVRDGRVIDGETVLRELRGRR